GTGAGKALVYKSVDFAREKHISIIPLCPFARAVFNKEDAIKDVL
ncbi:MAG: putative GNAT family acetyltransferase, partial [Marinoscillum sp.]